MHLPSSFINRTKALLGNEWNNFVEALKAEPPISVRINNKKEVFTGEPVPWCKNGLYLSKRPSFTLDPLFHAGCYYVQEASSMFVWQALTQYVPKNACMLDLCASPGGKSTLISEYLGADGFVFCNEIVRSRAYVLSENIQKWGNGNALVCNNEPKDLGKLTNMFDAILIDAPCSGEGMFRKDAGAVQHWSEENVNMCAARQRDILNDVWDALKPNGILIYSTCTFNKEENEENVQWICNELGATYLQLKTETEWQITDTGKGYHFYPHKTRGEGFFLAVLRKNNSEFTAKIKTDKRSKAPLKLTFPEVKEWVKNPDEWDFQQTEEGQIRAIPKNFANLIQIGKTKLSCISCGIELGNIKGKNVQPQQGLALSKFLNTKKIITFDASIETAIAFLRTEALTQIQDVPMGYVLLTYMNVPLGWAKNVGNRWNNLYPNEWRIRKNAN